MLFRIYKEFAKHTLPQKQLYLKAMQCLEVWSLNSTVKEQGLTSWEGGGGRIILLDTGAGSLQFNTDRPSMVYSHSQVAHGEQ